MRSSLPGAIVAGLLLAGCGSDSSGPGTFGRPEPDGQPAWDRKDASLDAPGDGVRERSGETGPDAPWDSSPDAVRDGSTAAEMARDLAAIPDGSPHDAPPLKDASLDVVDAAVDVPVDVAVDVPVDAAVDVPVDAVADVAVDAVVDAVVDVAVDAVVNANIGASCDPGLSDGLLENPACLGGTRCLIVRDPTDGLCTVFGCTVDLPTAGTNEESCAATFGAAYVCVDLDGSLGDASEPYDPPAFPLGQNADLQDNVCLPTCTPREDGNDCDPAFACAPDSTRLRFDGAVCYFPACADGTDCPVTTTPPGSCGVDADCDTSAGEFCTGVQDLDGDGTLEVRACAQSGVCDPRNGLCDPHTLGAPGASLGGPCAFDTECPNGSTCVLEAPVYDGTGSIVARVPHNGYCTQLGCRFAATLTSAACPAGSECNHNYYAGGCQPACAVGDAWGCRDNDCDPGSDLTEGCDWFGDLDCYDWSDWSFSSGLPLVGGPTGIVCDYDGPALHTCEDLWYASGGVGCSGVAPPGNPMLMDCRDLETAAPTFDEADPWGRCVDVTGSGPACADYGRLCEGICVDTGGGPCP